MTGLDMFGSTPFDAIRREDETGEYWSARDLERPLGYERWERFHDAIVRAEAAINNSGQQAPDHIRGSAKIVQTGQGERRIIDYRLTRFGAYMVAMNGDPRKREIADAQTYFAVKTREAETAPQIPQLDPMNNISHLSLILQAGHAALDRAIQAEAKVAELAPAAEAWTALAGAAGDYSLRDAAEVLCRDARIHTGQNLLMKYMREVGWVDRKGTPYQAQINLGRLAVRTRTYDDPNTGEPKITTQVRVTAKGVDAIHKLMTEPPTGLRSIAGGAA